MKNDKLDIINKNITSNVMNNLKSKIEKINYLENYSNSLNPNNVLKRGYSVVYNNQGKLVTKVENTKPQDKLDIKLYNGKLEVEVLKAIKKES